MLNIATWFVSEYFMRFYIGFVVGWYHWTEFSLPNSQIVCDRKMYKCAASNPWNALLYFRFYCDGAEQSQKENQHMGKANAQQTDQNDV